MTGVVGEWPPVSSVAEHIREAERLLAIAASDVSSNLEYLTGERKADVLAAAQVHATLALAITNVPTTPDERPTS